MAVDIPGYKVLRTLGRGGMATVYLAQQDIFEREVALKVMSRALADDESFGKRFFREAKIVSQLVHPNIVTVYDVGLHEGNYYLSMEHIGGSDLRKLRKTLTLEQKIKAICDIARALDYAGAKGYVHRDIKPENILFQSSDGRAVLTDFGIARAAEADTSMTQTGIAIGTPHYMSPEQAKGKAVDSRSDIYSLGVVFFLLLTGRVPYDAESAVAIGIKHITEPVPLLPDNMAVLQPIIDTLMAKRPEDRYQQAGELVDDLTRLDLELLEQTLSYDRNLQAQSVDSESPTEPGFGAIDSDLAFEDQDTIINERSGFFSWLVWILIFGSLIAWILYYQKPELVLPWLEKSKVFVVSKHEDTRQLLDEFFAEEKSPLASIISPVQKEESEKRDPPIEAVDAREKSDKVAAEPEPVPAKPLEPQKLRDQPVAPATSIAEYLRQLEALQALYVNDAAFLSELVALHKLILKDYPVHASTEKSLGRLRTSELNSVTGLLSEGKTEMAGKKLAQLQVLFPATPGSIFIQLQRQVENAESIERLFAEAEGYRKQGRLALPRGRSALDNYKKILQLDADSRAAKKGLQDIAGIFVARAQKDFDLGRLSSARVGLDKALKADSTYRPAVKLKNSVDQAIQRQQELNTWLSRAQTRLDRKAFFSPVNDNAYYYYQRVLEREPGNSQALTGQKQVVDSFARNIWSLVGNEQFDTARDQLAMALRSLPKNQRLQSLSLAVEEVVAEKL
ncbi:serine/threonine-protein kinase [Teredinibacter haidensis]|uniref:serine/threonine-protein kinase n=1 Tax=Teredinibacter haidensis TaxID=2731755 RepID=UPI000949184B|nr:serine/threonine-protein kinase [Teredinibacter haidensis]